MKNFKPTPKRERTVTVCQCKRCWSSLDPCSWESGAEASQMPCTRAALGQVTRQPLARGVYACAHAHASASDQPTRSLPSLQATTSPRGSPAPASLRSGHCWPPAEPTACCPWLPLLPGHHVSSSSCTECRAQAPLLEAALTTLTYSQPSLTGGTACLFWPRPLQGLPLHSLPQGAVDCRAGREVPMSLPRVSPEEEKGSGRRSWNSYCAPAQTAPPPPAQPGTRHEPGGHGHPAVAPGPTTLVHS